MTPRMLLPGLACLLAACTTAPAIPVPDRPSFSLDGHSAPPHIVPVQAAAGWRLCTQGCDVLLTVKQPVLPPTATAPAALAQKHDDIVSEHLVVSAHFASGSAALIDTRALDAITARVWTLIETGRHVRVEVIGYTDATGPAALNTRLAQTRADAVAARLAVGLPADRVGIHVSGKPQCCYIADNRTAGGRAENRRVTVSLRAKPIEGEGRGS